MKRITALLLAVCLAFTALLLFSTKARAEEVVDSGNWNVLGGRWKLTADGTLYLDMDTSKTAEWGKYADQVKKIVFGESVTSLWDNAMREMPALTEVVLGKNMTKLGKTPLQTVLTLPKSIFPLLLKKSGNLLFPAASNWKR